MIRKFNVEKTKQLDKINKILSLFYKKPNASGPIEPDQAKNILIVDFALMGDMIMDIPFLKSIRRNCPNVAITMVCMTWGEVILGDQRLVDEFIILNGKDFLSSPGSIFRHWKDIKGTIRKINSKSYDIGFEPKGDLRHTLFMRYTNCKRTVSYNYTGGDYLITDSFEPKADTKHLIDEKLDLLEMCGFKISDEDRIPELKLTDEWKEYADRFIIENGSENKKIIGIHPGASNVNKQYRYYPELVEKAEELLNDETIYYVFEGPGEERIMNEVTDRLDKLGRPYIRVKRKVKEYISLVSSCNLMICNDSAAGHIAAAYGIPAVVIFGPVKAETALPRGKAQIEFISHDMDCKPCTLPVCPKGTEECIKEISAEEVYEKFREIYHDKGCP